MQTGQGGSAFAQGMKPGAHIVISILARYAERSPAGPGERGANTPMRISLDSGSDVVAMAILEAFASLVQQIAKNVMITRPFDGRARIIKALGTEREIVTQTCHMHLAVQSPRRREASLVRCRPQGIFFRDKIQ